MNKTLYQFIFTFALLATSCTKDDVYTLDESKFIGEYKGLGEGIIIPPQPGTLKHQCYAKIYKENGRYYVDEIDRTTLDVIGLKDSKYRLHQNNNILEVQNEPFKLIVNSDKEEMKISAIRNGYNGWDTLKWEATLTLF